MQVSGIYNHPILGTLPLSNVEHLSPSQLNDSLSASVAALDIHVV